MLKAAEPGATFLLNSPYRAGRGLGPAADAGAAADHRQEAEVLRDRRLRGRHGRPAWAAASTRSCRPASSRSRGVLPREEAIEEIKYAIKKTYGKRGESGRPEELRGGRRHAGPPARGEGARPRSRRCSTCRPAGARGRARLRAERDGADHRRRGRRPARSARCRSTAPSRAARRSGRSATSPWRSRSGTRSSASSAASASWSARTRHPRQGLRLALAGRRARDVQVGPGALEGHARR